MDTIPATHRPRVLIWDLPTRVLHWMLAVCFAGAFGIAVFVRHRNPLFPVHMLLGALAAIVVMLRIVWGIVGTRYARFGSFSLGPRAVREHLRGLFSRARDATVGHNPANAWAAIAMLVSILGTAVTGALIPLLGGPVRPIHQTFAYVTACLVVVHLVGIALHTISRREHIALGMLDGKKEAPPALAIPKARPFVALAFVAIVGGSAAWLIESYDGASRTLTFPVVGRMKIGGGRQSADTSSPAPRPRRGNRG
jgi:cytochrome b